MHFPLKTSVRLRQAEALDMETITAQGSDQAVALAALTGTHLGTQPPAATALHAVVVAGLKAIDAKAEEIGYGRLTAFLETDDETHRWRQSRRARAARHRRTGAGRRVNPRRGHLYRMHDESYGTLFCLALPTLCGQPNGSCLAVRVSVTQEARDFPGWVHLHAEDPACGYVVTHDIDQVGHDELKEDLGPLSAGTVLRTEHTLKRVLGL